MHHDSISGCVSEKANSIARSRPSATCSRATRKTPAAHYNLGIALKNKDDIEGAKAELRRALAIDPQLAEAHYMIGIACWQSGDFE